MNFRPSLRSRFGLASASLMAVSLTLSACGVANSDSAGAAGDTVRIVLPQEPPTLEPCDANLTSTGVVVRSNITEPLVERDPASGELQPLLAPEDRDRQRRGQADVDRGAQVRWPAGDRSQRGGRPVVPADALGHLALADRP